MEAAIASHVGLNWELQEKVKIWNDRMLRKDLQSKDMGNTWKKVVALIGNILKQIKSISFADWVSCTTVDWLHRSHRAEKKRHDNTSHVRTHSQREFSLEKDAASCTMTLRVKDNTTCETHRNGKPRKKAPGHAKRQKERRRKGPSWLERESVATLHQEHQEHTSQVQQGQTVVRFQKKQV